MICNEKKVIQIITSADETSAPYNEYTLSRSKKRPEEAVSVYSYFSVDKKIKNSLKKSSSHERVSIKSAKGNPIYFIILVLKGLWNTKKSGKSALVHLHQPILAAPLLILSTIVLAGLPAIFTIHNNFNHFSTRNKIMCAIAFVLADYVTFVSHGASNSFPGILKKIKSGKWGVIQNGVDLSRVDSVLRDVKYGLKNSNKDVCNISTIGAMIEQKNQAFLLDVFSCLNETFHLTIVGDGPFRDELVDKSSQMGLENRVHFTGLLPRNDVFVRLSKSDAFVSASKWEGLPLAVMEAMAVGLPVFLSDIPPHRELNVETAPESSVELLPEDVDSWVDALQGFWHLDTEQRTMRGERSRSIVEGHFSLEEMHANYDEVYQGLWYDN